MGRTYRVGIIGVGGIAKTHMPGWRASGLTEVVACSDINGVILESWASEFGVSRIYARAEDLIRDPDIDIIDICTPNRYHERLAVAALKAGKHVLCRARLSLGRGKG